MFNRFHITLFLLLSLSLPLLTAPAFAEILSTDVTLEKMPGKTFADVQAKASAEAVTGPMWGNAPDPTQLPFHQTFTGTITADATMNKLAIFSDDGCDVYVDGAKVWSNRDTPQALPDISN